MEKEIDYQAEVISSVIYEFLEYYDETIGYDDCEYVFSCGLQNAFYSKLRDFFESKDCPLTEKHYIGLYEKPGGILNNLWEEYLEGRNYSFTNWSEIQEHIEDYIAESAAEL